MAPPPVRQGDNPAIATRSWSTTCKVAIWLTTILATFATGILGMAVWRWPVTVGLSISFGIPIALLILGYFTLPNE